MRVLVVSLFAFVGNSGFYSHLVDDTTGSPGCLPFFTELSKARGVPKTAKTAANHQDCSTKRKVTSAALFASPTDLSFSEETLWALRIGSAFASYVGFVAFFDRPRGKLSVELDGDIEIRPSQVPGAGLGLFAKRDLSRGTVLGTYPGTVIPLAQNLDKLRQYPPCEGYVWRFSDNQYVIDPTSSVGVLEDVCVGGNPSMPGSVNLFQQFSPLFAVSTALCRINEPPKGLDVNVVTSEDLQKRSVTFALERHVAAGEEFFIDYGLSYDRSMYNNAGK